MFRFHFRDGHFPANEFDPDNFDHCVLIVTASVLYNTIEILVARRVHKGKATYAHLPTTYDLIMESESEDKNRNPARNGDLRSLYFECDRFDLAVRGAADCGAFTHRRLRFQSEDPVRPRRELTRIR